MELRWAFFLIIDFIKRGKSRIVKGIVTITGTPFYKKMGYDYKNGIKEPDAEGLLRLEKFR